MPTLNVVLSVKFRALGFTFGNINQTWNEPLPDLAEILSGPRPLINFNQSGVSLVVTLKP
jgi:hypothetical protein